jgi:eukaryotic-like serine/threonine-protein kinase
LLQLQLHASLPLLNDKRGCAATSAILSLRERITRLLNSRSQFSVPAAPQTADEMLRLIERSQLVPLEKISARLNGRKPPVAALPFARWLVKTGLLTAFQADHLLLGKSRGFYLGDYRVLQRLGDGATADVFLCEHRSTKTRAAVKVLSQKHVVKKANVLRFRREARAAAALDHPNIVRTLGYGEDDGRHFLVMEYVKGVTLDQWLEDTPNAPVRAHVHFILQAAIGLKHLHKSNLIHRDIKPMNLLLDRHGTVKILDLGLAKFTDDRHDGLSNMEGVDIMGTPDFMSPEQCNGSEELDIRTDIYSLGASLYYLLTRGQVPFPAGNFGARLIAIQFQQPKPVAEFRPDVDPRLEKIVGLMMARDAGKRFQTPQDVVDALEGWLNGDDKKKDSRRAAPAVTQSKQLAPIALQSSAAANQLRPIKWALRVAAFLFVIWALVLLKPWNSRHRSAANTVTATE